MGELAALVISLLSQILHFVFLLFEFFIWDDYNRHKLNRDNHEIFTLKLR